MHVHLVWESSNFTVSWVPLIESLKSKAHLITDARKRKNLTHSATGFAFQGFYSYLKASAGLRRAACQAGAKPDTIPVITDMKRAVTTRNGEN
jgi:hypothetical protein